MSKQGPQSGAILVTGGAGYIGSHTCVLLGQAGFEVIIIDNFCNSSPSVVERIGELCGRPPKTYTGDVRDEALLLRIFQDHRISAVIHFAGLKAVGESVQHPLRYYDCNLGGALALLRAMERSGCTRMLFSSSATVYGPDQESPIVESASRAPSNPYGRTKAMIEDFLFDTQAARPDWSIGILRYFNPVGAHESGLIGESPQGIPSNLMPFICDVAIGRREKLNVFGGDWPTSDGTGVRDFIHVMDLAQGHVAALRRCLEMSGLFVVNLGTGQGHSVLELVRQFEESNNCRIPFEIVARRPGDLAQVWANPGLAHRLLGWKATRNIDLMCRDAWRWTRNAWNAGNRPQ